MKRSQTGAMTGVAEATLLPHSASVISSTRRTETPARHISMRASSTLLSRRRYLSIIAVSKEIPLETGYMERYVSRGCGKVSVVVAAAVALAGLVSFVASSLGQLLRFLLQQFIQRFFRSASDQLLSWSLITSSFSCTIFSDMVYRLLSEWCVVTSFYQSSANHVSFFPFVPYRFKCYVLKKRITLPHF